MLPRLTPFFWATRPFRTYRMVAQEHPRRSAIRQPCRGLLQTLTYLTSTTGVQIGLYAANSGQPGALLAAGSVSSNNIGWVDVPLPGRVSITYGTRYWLAIAASGNDTVTYRDSDNSGSDLDHPSNGLANPYSINGHCDSSPASVYLNGTANANANANAFGKKNTPRHRPRLSPTARRAGHRPTGHVRRRRLHVRRHAVHLQLHRHDPSSVAGTTRPMARRFVTTSPT